MEHRTITTGPTCCATKFCTILKLYRFANVQPEIIYHLYLVDLLLQTGSVSFHAPQKHVRLWLPSRVSWEALHVYDIAMVHSLSAFGSSMDNSNESFLGVDVEIHFDKHIPMLQSEMWKAISNGQQPDEESTFFFNICPVITSCN